MSSTFRCGIEVPATRGEEGKINLNGEAILATNVEVVAIPVGGRKNSLQETETCQPVTIQSTTKKR